MPFVLRAESFEVRADTRTNFSVVRSLRSSGGSIGYGCKKAARSPSTGKVETTSNANTRWAETCV